MQTSVSTRIATDKVTVIASNTTFVTLLSLLAAAVLWIALDAWLWGLPFALLFVVAVTLEPPRRRRLYLALAAPLLLPVMSGEARGLANNACSAAPVIPSVAP